MQCFTGMNGSHILTLRKTIIFMITGEHSLSAVVLLVSYELPEINGLEDKISNETSLYCATFKNQVPHRPTWTNHPCIDATYLVLQ